MKLILLALILLATPVWAEDCNKTCEPAIGYEKVAIKTCIQLCEIKEILNELVNK